MAHAALEAVAQISAECELQTSRLRMNNSEIKAAVEKAAAALAAVRDFELKTSHDETGIFFQKVVLLDEFVRELVAIDIVVRVGAANEQ